MGKTSKVIHVDDRVRVVVPMAVARVGYPKGVHDYEPLIEAQCLIYLDLLVPQKHGDHRAQRARKRIISELAYLAAYRDGFGGRRRELHLKPAPEAFGREFFVDSIRTVVTGDYEPASGHGEDFDPAHLVNVRRHRLVSGRFWTVFDEPGIPIEFPVSHLEKVVDTPVQTLID